MTDTAKTGASSKIFLSKIMTTHASGMGREGSNLDLLLGYSVTDVAGYFGVFGAFVSEGSAFARLGASGPGTA